MRKDDYYTGIAPKSSGLIMEKNNDIHRGLRKIANAAFSPNAINRFRLDMTQLIPELTSKLDEFVHSGEAVDLRYWLNLFAIDAIGHFAFTGSFGCIARGDPILDGILDDKVTRTKFDLSLDGPAKVASMAMTFFAEICGGAVIQTLQMIPALQKVEDLYFSVANNILEHVEEHRGSDTFIGQYLAACGKYGVPEDMEDLKLNSMNLLVAGSTTTSSSMTLVIWNLCKHPDIKKKIQDILDAELTRKPYYTHSEVASITYMKYIIDESMRLSPVVSRGLPRTVPEGGYTFEEYHLPAGSTVSVPLYSFFRSSAFENPDKFMPDRWYNPTQEMKDSFQPFSIGTRNCIGQEIARSEMMMMLCTLLRNYDFELIKEPVFFDTNLETKPIEMSVRISVR